MIIEKMEGQDRELLIDSYSALERRTKAAVGTIAGSFLPTTHATEQVERLNKLKASIPAYDDIKRDVEIIEPLIGLTKNSLVVHIWNLDAKVRGAEQGMKVPTRETDAKIERLYNILQSLGFEPTLEMVLKRLKKNTELVERDPAQIDIEDAVEAGAEA